MFCKWCGMESVTTDQCSWCHRPFTTTTDASGEKTSAEPAAAVAEEEEISPLAAQIVAPVANAATEPEPEEIKTPWDATAAAIPETSAAPAAPSHAPAPVIGVRRPGARGAGGHIPAPAMPPRSTGASSGQGASAHGPAPAISPRRTNEPASGKPHTPAPPIPTIAARSGTSPAAPLNRTAQTPAPARPVPPSATPTSSSRTAVPSALLGGGKSVPPASDTGIPPVASGGLADGVSLPPTAPTPAETHTPAFGTFTPAKSKYYSGQVVDPVSGTHYDSETGKPTTAPVAAPEKQETKRPEKEIEFIWDKPQATMWHLLGRYFGVYAILLALGVLATSIAPAAFPVILLLVNFIGGLLLPVMRVVPWQDEDSDDVFLMLVLTIAFGPVVSLIIYSVLTALRQDGNPAILGVLAVGMLSRLGIGLIAGNIHSWWHLMPFPAQGFTVNLMLINWAGLAALVGWYFGNIFHKFDE